MISSVVVCDRTSAKETWSTFGPNDIWITICSIRSAPLVNRSSKRVLVVKCDDIKKSPLTQNQARRIKNFILNHHKNNSNKVKLLINCIAGQSRSVAIGFFCQFNLNLQVEFREKQFPNEGIMQALNVPVEHRFTPMNMFSD